MSDTTEAFSIGHQDHDKHRDTTVRSSDCETRTLAQPRRESVGDGLGFVDNFR